MRIAIIGSGFAGLSAAYKLCKQNEVILFEKDEDIGGMSSSYHINDYAIEKYYHHIFRSDLELLDLITELGLSKELQWIRGSNGYFVNNKIYPMNTPFEILRFPPLSVFDIFRLGMMVLRIKLIKDTEPFDAVNASGWINKIAGNSVYENFFKPLLLSKFGANAEKVSAAWLIGRVKIRSNRGVDGEKLGYMKGGFFKLLKGLEDSILANGGKIHTKCRVSEIAMEKGAVSGIVANGKFIPCDCVISTIEPGTLNELTKRKIKAREKLESVRYQGTACVLFGLKKPLMNDIYWLNIKANVPFGAIIEHTNFLPLADYGEHLVYVTSYFQDSSDKHWSESEEKVLESYLKGLESMFPAFSRADVNWSKMYRRLDTAPVYETGYLSRILPVKTEVSGLYLAGMFSASNYPERSINGSVLAGFKCAELILKEMNHFD